MSGITIPIDILFLIAMFIFWSIGIYHFGKLSGRIEVRKELEQEELIKCMERLESGKK